MRKIFGGCRSWIFIVLEISREENDRGKSLWKFQRNLSLLITEEICVEKAIFRRG